MWTKLILLYMYANSITIVRDVRLNTVNSFLYNYAYGKLI